MHGAAVHASGANMSKNAAGNIDQKAAKDHQTEADKVTHQSDKDKSGKTDAKDDKKSAGSDAKVGDGNPATAGDQASGIGKDQPSPGSTKGVVPGGAYADPNAVASAQGQYLDNGQSTNQTQCVTAVKELADVPQSAGQFTYVQNADGTPMSVQQAIANGYDVNGAAAATLGYGNGATGTSGQTHAVIVDTSAGSYSTDSSGIVSGTWGAASQYPSNTGSGTFQTRIMNFDGSGWGSSKNGGAEAGNNYYILAKAK